MNSAMERQMQSQTAVSGFETINAGCANAEVYLANDRIYKGNDIH